MRRADLIADCNRCAAICCVATSFEASDDFAFDKAAGAACQHLEPDGRCAIHAQLLERGCSGCAVYDCYGAGPRTTRLVEGTPDAEGQRVEAFLVLRVVHEWLWLLTEAVKLCPAAEHELETQLAREVESLDVIAGGSVDALLAVDLHAHQTATHSLLRRLGVALGERPRRSLIVVE